MSEEKQNKVGVKFDLEKPMLDLIPYDSLEEIGKVLNFGAKKYDRANWANGISYSRLISASLRHINQFNKGEDKDPESQASHIANAACNLIFLLWMEKSMIWRRLNIRGWIVLMPGKRLLLICKRRVFWLKPSRIS